MVNQSKNLYQRCPATLVTYKHVRNADQRYTSVPDANDSGGEPPRGKKQRIVSAMKSCHQKRLLAQRRNSLSVRVPTGLPGTYFKGPSDLL